MRLISLVLTAAFVSASLIAADWPQFRGPGGLGVATDRGLPTKWSGSENIVWKTELPGAGTSSPVFVNDRIYLTSYSGDSQSLQRQLVCLDRQSGDLRWAKDVKSKLPEQERIRDDHGYASSTPYYDGEKLYVFFGKSGLFAFDLEGKQLWQADAGSGLHGWGSANSPVVHENLVIINASVESKSLIAFDKKSGKEIWRARGINESWNTPVLVTTDKGQTELVLAIYGKVLGFDPKSGNQLWSCATDIPWYMVPSIVASEGIVYCIGGRGPNGTLAIRTGGKGDVTKTHRLWLTRKGSNVSSPVFHDKYLFWAHESQGIVYCADAKSGEVLYEERLPRAGQFYASALLADGKVYYVTRNGRTFVVAATPKFELLATNDLDDRSAFNASPVAADGRLFIRSDKYLYCIDE